MLSLTRILKESWLFGKLQTVGVSEAETRAEEAARKVAEGLARLQSDSHAEPKAAEGDSVVPMDKDGENEEAKTS